MHDYDAAHLARQLQATTGTTAPLRTAEDVTAFLIDIIARVEADQLTPATGEAVAKLSVAFLQALGLAAADEIKAELAETRRRVTESEAYYRAKTAAAKRG